jgi:hypothetical protein
VKRKISSIPRVETFLAFGVFPALFMVVHVVLKPVEEVLASILFRKPVYQCVDADEAQPVLHVVSNTDGAILSKRLSKYFEHMFPNVLRSVCKVVPDRLNQTGIDKGRKHLEKSCVPYIRNANKDSE